MGMVFAFLRHLLWRFQEKNSGCREMRLAKGTGNGSNFAGGSWKCGWLLGELGFCRQEQRCGFGVMILYDPVRKYDLLV
jgi:hypothetical protein